MQHYPVFLDLTGKRCLVVGAGKVGLRKITTLIECGAGEIIVIDPAPSGRERARLLEHPRVTSVQREFSADDLTDTFLVLAATNKPELNTAIGRLCLERNILCNIADQPELCSFILPSIFSQGALTFAISTAGSSPALARKIRERLGNTFGPEYALLLGLMGQLRPLIIGLGHGSNANAKVFRSLTDDAVLAALKDKDPDSLLQLLRQRLPDILHPQLEALCDDLSQLA